MVALNLWREDALRESVKRLARQLSEAYGPSGHEDEVRDTIKREIEPFADEIKVDALGSLHCTLKSDSGSKVMLAAHMDEVGVVVTHIDDEGYLRFSNVGGADPEVLLGQSVVFKDGTIGVVGAETEKMAEGRRKFLEHLAPRSMFIDIGSRSRDETGRKVRVGDVAVYRREFSDLGARFSGKALDDRIGCAILVVLARALRERGILKNELNLVFTVQEEVGVRGATTSSYAVYPDLAIAVDVTRTGDTPKSERMAVSLGKGVAVKVRDSRMVADPGVVRLLAETAERCSIPYQMEVLERGSTDASAIQLARSGVRTGALSIPCRYVHSPCEVSDWDDVGCCLDLLGNLLSSPLEF